MFGLSGCAFRFGNVVGPRQTHGVGFDFARRLLDARARGDSPIVLKILGDGTQSKSYVYVTDIVQAVLTAHERTGKDFEAYNVATGDYITVTEIAGLAAECIGLSAGSVRFEYTGGDRGWKGDVPIVRLATSRIRALGWENALSSREALRRSILAMIPPMQAGLM
jgi:UDP-glucose 4-epimerase